jgi:hypothetical protein
MRQTSNAQFAARRKALAVIVGLSAKQKAVRGLTAKERSVVTQSIYRNNRDPPQGGSSGGVVGTR